MFDTKDTGGTPVADGATPVQMLLQKCQSDAALGPRRGLHAAGSQYSPLRTARGLVVAVKRTLLAIATANAYKGGTSVFAAEEATRAADGSLQRREFDEVGERDGSLRFSRAHGRRCRCCYCCCCYCLCQTRRRRRPKTNGSYCGSAAHLGETEE